MRTKTHVHTYMQRNTHQGNVVFNYKIPIEEVILMTSASKVKKINTAQSFETYVFNMWADHRTIYSEGNKLQ